MATPTHTPDEESVALVEALGYTKVGGLWPIVQHGVRVEGNQVLVTEIEVDDRGVALRDHFGVTRTQVVTHPLPNGWVV